jgi:hypothetical protein
MYWINHHGVEALIIAAVYSMITSCMPPLPKNSGWWSTWFYSVVKFSGANIGDIMRHTPLGAQLSSMVSNTSPDGSKTIETIDASIK